ncbi:AsnC family protein [Homoserinibacter sp. YIM 151385]|uniref:AsnC family protein n=1 Tax=Homoserinibacter sp. YIM 151385 TaxID=2985506 RepID=UPI0022F05255|nr:AsnC family protein [Homoserinibacter sp. YIM 151385]WBU36844.1 AsnC family protein [Homoserinibacter sp. YIM 151385]
MPARPLAEETPPPGPLAELRELRARQQELLRQEAALVRQARAQGCGWQMIATALGVSRQAVHKRYGRR